MKHFNLIVVGAGFSGLACAREAAKQGLKTHIYERKITPGAYTQSTGILVKEIAEQINLPSELYRKISGVRLYAPNMESIDLTSPHYYFLATDTVATLEWMARQAKIAGATMTCSETVGIQANSIIPTHERILLPRQKASCDYLVAADGARSKLARQLKLGVNEHFLYGAEYEALGFEHLDSNYLHVFLDGEHAPGYIGWLVPGVHAAQIGLASHDSKSRKLQSFVDKLAYHFKATPTILAARGGVIPCGGIVKPLAKGNICLLGDAAGMVSPLTAGGIHPSIELGQHLGGYIADYLYDDNDAPDKRLSATLTPYSTKRYLRTFYNRFTPPNSWLNAAISNPLFRRFAQVIFFHHRGLLCKEAWREILWSR